jgi:hypothetical protein
LTVLVLNLNNPEVLLHQLQTENHRAEFSKPNMSVLQQMGVTGPGEVPHLLALQQFFAERGASYRARWAPCLREFIAQRAPLKSARTTAFAELADFSWEPTNDLVAELFQEYLATGLIDVSKVLPGKLAVYPLYPDDESPDAGRTLLAAAILRDVPHIAKGLLTFGVPLNVGVVTPGGPERDALDLAQERRSGSVAAVISEFVLTRQLQEVLHGAQPDDEPHATGNTRGLVAGAVVALRRRKRMGV